MVPKLSGRVWAAVNACREGVKAAIAAIVPLPVTKGVVFFLNLLLAALTHQRLQGDCGPVCRAPQTSEQLKTTIATHVDLHCQG